jgi:diaminopimelate decarboxylase
MLWPITTGINAAGHLAIDGVDLVDLARDYGTPLYVYDEATIRERCRQHAAAFARHYPQGRIVYAGKAYLSPAILAILKEEGTWLDVCSGGELGLALRCGFPAERIVFHGNNKSPEELRQGVAAGLGVIVVDNLLELERIIAIGDELGKRSRPRRIFRYLGMLPAVGAVADYFGEYGALVRAAKAGRAWIERQPESVSA